MKFQSIKNKIVILFSTFIFILLLIIMGGTYFYFDIVTKKIISDNQFSTVTTIAHGIDNGLKSNLETLIKAANKFPMETLKNSEEISRWLDNNSGLKEIFTHSIIILDSKGVLVGVSPSRPDLLGESFEKREYFQNTIKKGQPFISMPFVTVANNYPVIMMTAPLKDKNGDIIGILGGAINLFTQQGFVDSILGAKAGTKGYFYLFAKDRTIIVHPDSSRIMKKDVNPGSNKFFDKAIDGFEGSGVTTNSKGIKSLSSFKELDSTGWILAANFPYDEAIAPIIEFRNYFFLSMIFIITLSIFLAKKLGLGLVKPLTVFTKQISEVSQDNTKIISLDSSQDDEIGELAKSFNKMIEEIHKHQSELLFSKERFKNLSEIFPETIYETDLSGRITYANEHGLEQFGYTKEDLENGINIRDLVAPQYRSIVTERTIEKLGGIDNGYLEHKGMKKDGSLFHALGMSVAIINNGVPTGIRGFVLNISQRKEFEEELQKSKKQAEEANVAKGQFLANMSHEIRTPMNGIFGFLELLETTNLNSTQKEYIREAKSSSTLLLNIINDILDFSKIESKKLTIENIHFNLRTTVEDSVSLFLPKAKEKNIDIYLMVKATTPEEVIGDPTRVRQILNNLLGNAVKFTEKGDVSLTVDSTEEENQTVDLKFEIKDTGIGLKKEQIQKLFQSFTQADSSITRKYGGTGLGLVISKQLAQIMGGDISVESNEGEGSIFSFNIKLKIAKNNLEYKKRFADLSDKNILIVDNNDFSRKILMDYLQETGIKIFESTDFGNAVTQIISQNTHEDRIDLIIINHQLPHMDAYEFSNILKNIPNAKNIKLILLSSTYEKGDSHHALEYGFLGYLSKPVKRDELVNCVSLVLQIDQIENLDNEIITKHTIKELKNSLKSNILLVEDYEVNRKIVLKMLETRDLTCDVANDGMEALLAMKKKDYDIVFMDCQMPIMDGFECTKKIREYEANEKHTTIVAMTAHAMESDRIKCLESGMDDYISKPIDFKQMFKLIEENTLKNKKAPKPFELINIYKDQLMKNTGLSSENIEKLFEIFIDDLNDIIIYIYESLESGDIHNISRYAHQLRGSAGNLGVTSIYDVATKLEEASKNNDSKNCYKFFKELKELVE